MQYQELGMFYIDNSSSQKETFITVTCLINFDGLDMCFLYAVEVESLCTQSMQVS
jgi:hypothetical protein